jgi:hypothetical protein
MLFVAAGDVELHIDRVKSRGNGGGHSASEASLREIYARAMGHLVTAFQANQRYGNDSLSCDAPHYSDHAGELTAAMMRGQAGLTLVDAPALPQTP